MSYSYRCGVLQNVVQPELQRPKNEDIVSRFSSISDDCAAAGAYVFKQHSIEMINQFFFFK